MVSQSRLLLYNSNITALMSNNYVLLSVTVIVYDFTVIIDHDHSHMPGVLSMIQAVVYMPWPIRICDKDYACITVHLSMIDSCGLCTASLLKLSTVALFLLLSEMVSAVALVPPCVVAG